MIAAGTQAIWEFGQAIVLVAVAADRATVEVTVMDRGWEGEERREHYRLTREADGAWQATPPVDGVTTATDWTGLLPVICHLSPPGEIMPAAGETPAF